jgi:hypothetical protein
MFAHRISRRQVLAVLLMATGLAVLPIGLRPVPDRLDTGALIALSTAVMAAAAAASGLGRPWLKAIAAGALYGVADGAIKAVVAGWPGAGGAALWSPWTVLATLATFAGFLAFQSALSTGGAVSSISLMNALAALVALASGLIAFGETLGATRAALLLHLVAIAVVLGCVPALAGAQARLAEGAEDDGAAAPRRAPALTA